MNKVVTRARSLEIAYPGIMTVPSILGARLSTALRNPRLLLRSALIVASYLCAFTVLDLLARAFEELPGIVAWYPAAGLSFALLLVFGARFAPALAIASLISSFAIYRLSDPPEMLLLWAFLVSLIYGVAAAVLRHRLRFDWHLGRLRDVSYLILATVLVSVLLAALSVSGSALSGALPLGGAFRAVFDWWIGETVGVLTVAPFLLVYVLPWLKRFTEGRSVVLPAPRSFPRPTLSAVGQAFSIGATLYWVFGAPVPGDFRPLYLVTLPLIWIALQRGFKGVTAGIVALNAGVIAAIWLLGLAVAPLAGLELLMIGNCAIGLTMGAVVTERGKAEEAFDKLSQKDEEALSIARMGHWELDMTTTQFTFNDQYYSLHGTTAEEAGGYVMSVEKFISRYLHPDDAALIGEAIRRISETNDPSVQLQQGARILRADGELRDVDVWLRGEKDSQGRITKIRGVNQDVTERKRVETELITANKELVFQNEEKEERAVELVLANEETVRRLQDIQALHKIDQAIAGSLDLNLTLNVVLEQVKTQLNIDAAAVLLLNRHTQILEFTSGLGFRSEAIERSRLRLGEGHSGRAALERRTVSVTDLLENSTQFDRAALLADEGFATYFGTPLIAKGEVNGVLEIYHRLPFVPDENWLEFFEILAGQAAIAVDSAGLLTDLIHSNAELLAAYDSTIEGWSHALDLRDKETEGHTQRVTEMAVKLARAAGIAEEELPHVRRGALLHDIGKMGAPDNILLKPGELTDEEWVVMRKHPTFAFELLSPIAYLRPALDIPHCHHEKWDGSGYPRGLKGEQIPLATRLFAIIDVWDALRSDRPYRQGWSKERVIEHIKSFSGTHFDPKAVELFLNTVNEAEENAG